jgi:serine/threonine protein kinase
MHERGFLHRDLKPENFCINSKTLEVKIIDFGTVKDMNQSSQPFTTYISTRWYRSPECVLRSENYGPASDIFAIGCLMCELFNNDPLFPGKNELD